MNLQKYNQMKKPANRLYMALALGAGICLTASCASDDGFATDEGALELQRIEVEGEESVTRAEATAITEVDVYATTTASATSPHAVWRQSTDDILLERRSLDSGQADDH